MGTLKKALRRSMTEKTLDPWIFPVKSFNKGRGWASTIVLALSALKSEQGLAPPPAFGARWRAELQSVLVPALTSSMTPSSIILSHANFPSLALAESITMGLLFVLQGAWLPVSILCQTP